MSAESHSQDPVVTAVLQDPAADEAHAHEEQPHDHAAEVAHAWHHFRDNAKFFACFFSIIMLTVASYYSDFGAPWNGVVLAILTVVRCALMAWFMASLFRPFSIIFRTFLFSALFLAGMIFLSWWDSELKGIGDPIKDRIHETHEQPQP